LLGYQVIPLQKEQYDGSWILHDSVLFSCLAFDKKKNKVKITWQRTYDQNVPINSLQTGAIPDSER